MATQRTGNPMGRPIEYTPEVISKIIKKMEEYIEETDIPIIAEFAYRNDIRKATLYDIPDFSYYLKKLLEKKEAQLEKGMLSGKLNTTGCVFSLKQIGWSDKIETRNTNETRLFIERDKDLNIEQAIADGIVEI